MPKGMTIEEVVNQQIHNMVQEGILPADVQISDVNVDTDRQIITITHSAGEPITIEWRLPEQSPFGKES